VAVTDNLQFAIYQCYRVAYNLLLHPLRGFPGPFIQRASPIPFFYFHVTGTQIFRTQRPHDSYGPVVRIAPNHLSFTDPRAWRDIYAHRPGPGGHPFELPKADIFYSANKSFPTSIANAGPEEHERIRGALAPGFSDAAMRRQEPVISGYADLLVRRLAQNCNGGKDALDISKWFHWATFDIMGTLVFAQSFGCLEESKAHPWVSAVIRFVKDSSKLTGLSYLGFHTVVEVLSHVGMRYTAKYQAYVAKMLDSRLAVKFERDDLFESLLQKREEWVSGRPFFFIRPLAGFPLSMGYIGSRPGQAPSQRLSSRPCRFRNNGDNPRRGHVPAMQAPRHSGQGHKRSAVFLRELRTDHNNVGQLAALHACCTERSAALLSALEQHACACCPGGWPRNRGPFHTRRG
jgi:hypothetical protein